MRMTGIRNRSGFTLYLILLTMMIVFGAIGSSIALLANATRSVRLSADRAQARSLAEGAWLAARTGLANEGSGYAGFGEKELGRGKITVKITRGPSADVLDVIATGEVLSSHGICSESVFATVRVVDANPAGSKIGEMKISSR